MSTVWAFAYVTAFFEDGFRLPELEDDMENLPFRRYEKWSEELFSIQRIDFILLQGYEWQSLLFYECLTMAIDHWNDACIDYYTLSTTEQSEVSNAH